MGPGPTRESTWWAKARIEMAGQAPWKRKSRIRSWSDRRMSSDEGSSLVEFAVSIPVLLTFFFGLIQVCMASYTRAAISECAREGTRYAMVHGSSCETSSNASCTLTASAINTYVSSNSWPNLGGGSLTVSTTYPDGNESPGSRVQVAVTYAFPFRIPMIPASTLTMTSTSVMYIAQ